MKKLVDHSAGIVYYFPDYIDAQSLSDDNSRFRCASFIIQGNKMIKCRMPLLELIETHITRDENITLINGQTELALFESIIHEVLLKSTLPSINMAFDTSYFSMRIRQDSNNIRFIIVNAPRQSGKTTWLMNLYDKLVSVEGGLPVRIHASRHVDIGQRERYNERISDRMIVLCDETLPQRIHPESTYILVETV